MSRLVAVFMLLCLACTPVEALEHVRLDESLLSVERGAETVMTVCHGCHGMKYLKYHDLINLGLDKAKVAGWRGDRAPDAALTSRMPDEAAMQAFGRIPPDLSLMVKVPENGADYVYSYLLGFYMTPQGQLDNHLFPGTRMPDVLGVVGMNDVERHMELQRKAADVVAFLDWAADPHAAERRRIGYYAIVFLVVWTALLYWLKREIWAGIETVEKNVHQVEKRPMNS